MTSINRQTSYSQRLQRVSSAFVLLCFFALPAFAATSLSGSLTDPAGGVVPSATIRLLRLADSSRPHETFTDTQGQFFFASLSPGEYLLTAEFPGFAPVVRTLTLAD